MVLDVKAMSWAAQNDIDTAKLKAAKMPIYGKWYFPEIPANVPMVNLETGERRTFDERMIAGEVIWVAEADLRRARLGPFASVPSGEAAPPPSAAPAAPVVSAAPVPVEPTIAMSRGAAPAPAEMALTPLATVADAPADAAALAGIHLPRPSIAPFVLGVGMGIALLGLITHPIVLAVGLVWSLAGAIGWIRIGLLEARDAASHEHS